MQVTPRKKRYPSNPSSATLHLEFQPRYYRKERGCDTWGWIDNELPTRVTIGIMKLMDQVDSLTKELEETKERMARLKSKDTIIKMLIFIIVVLVILLIK
ncbi:hypothetical protein Dimus_020160 [Dionaea muscipula]